MKWLFKPKNIVIIDIGSHSLKLAEFSVKKKKPLLENFVQLPVMENCIEQGDLMDDSNLKGHLKNFISQNTTLTEVYVVMSGRSVIVKKLEILRSEENLLDDLMREEVKQHLPFNIDDINYDYSPLKVLNPEDENKMNVLLFAAKKEAVAKIDDLVEGTGYRLLGVDMGALALSSCINLVEQDLNKKNQGILVLDIGKDGTGFSVVQKGALVFSKYLNVGSDLWTQNIMRDMSMEYSSAEALKFSWCAGDGVPPELENIMKESCHTFCEELAVGYEYFKNQFNPATFASVYITGGGGKISTLSQFVSKRFNVSCRLLDPFSVLPYNNILEESLDYIKYFTPMAVGACLRRLG